MAPKQQPDPKPPPQLNEWLRGLIVLLSVLTVVGLTIADFADDGNVHREWIAALVFIAFTFAGYGADKILGKRLGP